MSATCSVKIDSSEEWFTGGEILRGTVFLNLFRQTDIRTVSVGLICELFASLTRVDDNGHKWTDSETVSSIMFEEWRQLFPAESLTGAHYKLNSGSMELPFTFTLPTRSNSNENHPLPPSLSDVSDDIMIRYFLRVKVKKPNSLTTTCWKPVVYLPVDPDLEFVPAFAAKTTSVGEKQRKSTVKGILDRISMFTQDSATTCRSATFVMRCETLLTPDVKFSLLLSAICKDKSGSMCVEDISVALVCRTETVVKNIDKVTEKKIPLLFQQDVNVVVSLADKDNAKLVGEYGLRLPDTIPPTFATNIIKRSYALDVRIVFRHMSSPSECWKSKLYQKIWVRSGVNSDDHHDALPAYGDPHLEMRRLRPHRKFPQARRYFYDRDLTWIAAPS